MHTRQLHGRAGTKSSKALFFGSQARPPHITMEMALHGGVRINALEGSWHVCSPVESVDPIHTSPEKHQKHTNYV